MTDDAFTALAKLLSMREGPAREAARLVLVEGMRQADAARLAGCSPQSVANALTRARAGMELVRLAGRRL